MYMHYDEPGFVCCLDEAFRRFSMGRALFLCVVRVYAKERALGVYTCQGRPEGRILITAKSNMSTHVPSH